MQSSRLWRLYVGRAHCSRIGLRRGSDYSRARGPRAIQTNARATRSVEVRRLQPPLDPAGEVDHPRETGDEIGLDHQREAGIEPVASLERDRAGPLAVSDDLRREEEVRALRVGVADASAGFE